MVFDSGLRRTYIQPTTSAIKAIDISSTFSSLHSSNCCSFTSTTWDRIA